MGITLSEWQSFAFTPPETYVIGLAWVKLLGARWFIRPIYEGQPYWTFTGSWDAFVADCRELGIDEQIPAYAREMTREE